MPLHKRQLARRGCPAPVTRGGPAIRATWHEIADTLGRAGDRARAARSGACGRTDGSSAVAGVQLPRSGVPGRPSTGSIQHAPDGASGSAPERSGAGHQWHFPARRERAHRHAHTHLVHLYLLRPEFAPSCDDHQLRIMSYTTHLEAHHLEEPLTRVEADGLPRQVVGSASAAQSTPFNTPAAKASRRSMTPTHVGAWCPPSSHCARAASGSIPGGVLTCTLHASWPCSRAARPMHLGLIVEGGPSRPPSAAPNDAGPG